jgi:hypothetical protein
MFNFPFADDSPQYKADTLRLFEEIKSGRFEPYTSSYAIEELEATPEEGHRLRMLKLIPDYGVKLLDSSPEVERLAYLYTAMGAVPVGFYTDALHIAMTAVCDLDFIVSLNFKHIVKEKAIKMVTEINAREGFRSIGIYKPVEVLNL